MPTYGTIMHSLNQLILLGFEDARLSDTMSSKFINFATDVSVCKWFAKKVDVAKFKELKKSLSYG